MALPISGEVPDLERAALLWSQLPAESRTAKLQAPALEWETGDYLLWQIEFHLRELMWSLAYDKKHPQPKPRPLVTPAQMAEAHRKGDAALASREEIDKKLGLEGMNG